MGSFEPSDLDSHGFDTGSSDTCAFEQSAFYAGGFDTCSSETTPPLESGTDWGGRRFRTRKDELERQRWLDYLKSESKEAVPALIVAQVALRQVESPGLDEHQQTEELIREFEVSGVKWEAHYLNALSVERERLIDAEIGLRLKAKISEDEAMLLIILAAYV